jgi:hypothetical protein
VDVPTSRGAVTPDRLPITGAAAEMERADGALPVDDLIRSHGDPHARNLLMFEGRIGCGMRHARCRGPCC